MLEINGFAPMLLIKDENNQEIPDISSLSDTIVDILTDYSNITRNYSEMETALNRIESENKEMQKLIEKSKNFENQVKDMEKINRLLNEKINKYKQEIGGGDGN